MTLYCDKCGARHDSSVCPSCSGFGKSPPMTAPDDVRARFEAWLLRLGYTSRPERRPSGKYVNGQIQGNWLAWQAAHADLSGEVRELVEADRLMDKCDAALESHRDAKVYDEAWGATQLELHRTRDLAAERRSAALAKFTQEKP